MLWTCWSVSDNIVEQEKLPRLACFAMFGSTRFDGKPRPVILVYHISFDIIGHHDRTGRTKEKAPGILFVPKVLESVSLSFICFA